MSKRFRVLKVVLVCLCLLSSCSLPPSTQAPSTLPSIFFEHCTQDLLNAQEENDGIYLASGNDFADTLLSWSQSLTQTQEGLQIYCALPVFPTEEQDKLWKTAVEERLGALQTGDTSLCQALKADFVLDKVASLCRLEAVFAVCQEGIWTNSEGFYRYWNPQSGEFMQFLSFFSEFSEYHTYFAEYLSQQCSRQFADSYDEQKLAQFLQTDLSFQHFEVGEGGLSVTLDASNLLKDGLEGELWIPDYYYNGGIVEKIANQWKEYAPAQPGEKVIALTFDDGPSNANTNQVLDVLEKYQVKATFFVAGHRISNSTGKTLRRILGLGSQIGNHSYSHANFNLLTDEEMLQEIQRTQDAVFEATGTYPTCLRPPYGNLAKDRVATTGMYTILWNEDTLDWKYRDTQLLVETVLADASSGDIILMHDIHKSTSDAVEAIVQGLLEQGYRLVTVEELLDLRSQEPTDLKYFSQHVIR